MEFVVLWILATTGAFTLIMTALVLLYIAYVMWQDRRQARPNEPVACTAGAAYDACEEPMRYSIHDEVDMIVEALQ